MKEDYAAFLASRSQLGGNFGFAPTWLPDSMFDFQKHLVEWALLKGRAAIFADTGLGKTLMQLVWAENIVRRENRPVLILTPLAVASQTMREAEKFGIECGRSSTGTPCRGITITNYQKLHLFNAADFCAVVCDESSILKSFDGTRRQQITEFMRKLPYRLLCTATAAPNDYFELGTSSEALGYLGHMDMLNRFFKNDLGNSATRFAGRTLKWRFKGHSETAFWRWVCSWARAVRRPSELGFPNDDFTLPPLTERCHVVTTNSLPDGMLFSLPATTLPEQRDERRRSIKERCAKVAELVTHLRPALCWCHLNTEGDMLEKMIPGAVQISGSDTDEGQEEKLIAFINGRARVLITKPTIGAWGLNFQHCSHVSFFPSHSFEQFYQGVRRCWRYGQKNNVTVDIVTTEGERDVMANLQAKAVAADKMFDRIVASMGQHLSIRRSTDFLLDEEVPQWL